jgi:hypothetical protein
MTGTGDPARPSVDNSSQPWAEMAMDIATLVAAMGGVMITTTSVVAIVPSSEGAIRPKWSCLWQRPV